MASLILFAVLSVGCTGAVPNPVFRVFYLNLNKSQDRRTHMDKLLSDFPGAVERVPAISGEQVVLPPFDAYIERQGVDPDLILTTAHDKRSLPNTIACWLSHVRLWERLQTELKRNEVALILEDDVWVPSNLTEALLDTVHSAPSHWDVLKVCGWGMYRAADLVNDKWAVTTEPVFERTTAGDIVDGPFYGGSCGYLVHAMSLPRVLKHVLSQKIKDIDVAMLVHQSLNNLRGSERKLGSDFAVFEQLPDKKIILPAGFASTIGSNNSSNSSSAPPTPSPTPAPPTLPPMTPSPTTFESSACCTANRQYNDNQVSVCGCHADAFPAGAEFLLNGQMLTVSKSWSSACISSCGDKNCATVNLETAVTHDAWSDGDTITFPTKSYCTANRQYNKKQVSVCGCHADTFPAGAEFFLNGQMLTVSKSWSSACISSCGEQHCATVNLKTAVTSGAWSNGDAITFPGACPGKTMATPAPPPVSMGKCVGTDSRCKGSSKTQCNRLRRQGADCSWDSADIGSPTPAPFSFDSLRPGRRCHKKFLATGEWGDLGQKITQETCLSSCRQSEGCKYVSFGPDAPSQQVGTCTSFTACRKTQKAKDHTTWKRVEITPTKDEKWCSMNLCKRGNRKCDTSFVIQTKCKHTCSLCKVRRLQHAGDELTPLFFG